MPQRTKRIVRRVTSLALAYLLSFGSAHAGILVTCGDGIQIAGADGIQIAGADGIQIAGADGILSFGLNGIQIAGADGIQVAGADGIQVAGADGIQVAGADGASGAAANGIQVAGADGIQVAGADGIQVAGADGIQIAGADGIQIAGADGTQYRADSIVLRQANGIQVAGADTARAVGVNGIQAAGADGIQVAGADGIQVAGADGIQIAGADTAVVKGSDGRVSAVAANGLRVTGGTLMTMTGADGIVVTGADRITRTGAAAEGAPQPGLQSVDPELMVTLDRAADDSTINAVVVYHRLPTDQDIYDLQRIGITGGTRFHVLPMLYVTGTRDQIIALSHLPSVRSIYGNRTLQLNADPARGATLVERASTDRDVVSANSGMPLTGRGVTVAVLDTGVDGTHSDLAGRVVQNVKLADLQSAAVGFQYPANVEGVADTDQAHGHGTFVAGVVAGNGARSSGLYTGVAPGARILGLGAGDVNLVFVLNGFDHLLRNRAALGVRVVNCSFSANTVYDANDPVNVATRLLTDRGVNVVFSAGNTGPGMNTLNPYAAAPWVVSVGATDGGRLASFSSRGVFASAAFRPTLVAPGVKVTGLRSTGVNQTGTEGVGFNADTSLPPTLVPFYTTATGTSFSAPQVAGTIALMLEANPALTPAQVKDILQRTATPLAPYMAHETGAGLLNAHAAVLASAFPQRSLGRFRASLDRGQVRFVSDPAQVLEGRVVPGAGSEVGFNVPEGALFASVQIGWGPLWSLNDLGLAVVDPAGARQADVNVLNLPGLAGRRERAVVAAPAAGAWRAVVKNTLGLAGTAQDYKAVVETGRAEYAPLRDLDALNAAQRADVLQSIRTFVMAPTGANFRPSFAVSRADFAQALVLGARVPQYMPAVATYSDVRDQATMIYVESVQRSPRGAFFTDVAPGGRFSPDAPVTRLAAAVMLVRAAGLEQEVGAQPPVALSDALSIPEAQRGYVYVALARGLMRADGGAFRPQNSITRLDLARAMVSMQRVLTQ
jgi:serine protease AprX